MTRNRTPYADDALRAENGTEPDDIRDFVKRRSVEYHIIHGKKIWNFNNHEIDYDALENQIDNFMFDKYLIPFQASGIWGYMFHLMPEELQQVEILAYNQTKGEYIPYPNYLRHSDADEDEQTTKQIMDLLGEDDRSD